MTRSTLLGSNLWDFVLVLLPLINSTWGLLRVAFALINDMLQDFESKNRDLISQIDRKIAAAKSEEDYKVRTLSFFCAFVCVGECVYVCVC